MFCLKTPAAVILFFLSFFLVFYCLLTQKISNLPFCSPTFILFIISPEVIPVSDTLFSILASLNITTQIWWLPITKFCSTDFMSVQWLSDVGGTNGHCDGYCNVGAASESRHATPLKAISHCVIRSSCLHLPYQQTKTDRKHDVDSSKHDQTL